jgi:hypothetical protein
VTYRGKAIAAFPGRDLLCHPSGQGGKHVLRGNLRFRTRQGLSRPTPPRTSGWLAQLMPMPATTAIRPAGRFSPSTRIPATFRPSSSTSFGHFNVQPLERLRSGEINQRPVQRDRRDKRQSGRQRRSAPDRSGRSEAARLPRSVDQGRPRRPRPAVCTAAVIHKPPGSPRRAAASASPLVEGSASKAKWRYPAGIAAGIGQNSARAAVSAASPTGPGEEARRRR